MANNSKRTLTLDLRVDLDSKEAERNIEALGKEFLSLMSKMNKSGKGMNVFKDLVGYISRLDSEMTTFRREHADDFNRIFGDIDTTLLNQMQTIFGVTKAQLAEINTLRDKVAASRKNPNTSADEIKSMEKEVRDLYAAIGKSGESGISGKGKIETRFDRLEESLNNFARTWESVNDRVSKGFGSGLGSAGSELEGFSKEVQQEIDNIQNEIEELKKVKKQYENTVKDLKSAKDNKGLVNEKKYGPETSVEGVQKLMDEYTALQQKIKSGSKDSVEYYQNLNRLSETAIKLSNSQKAIGLDDNLKKQFKEIPADNKNYPNKFVELLSYQNAKLDSVRDTVGKADIKNIDNFIKAKQQEIEVVKQANDVYKQTDKIQTQSTAYDELIAKVKEYQNVVNQLENAETDAEMDSWADKQEELEMDIAEMSRLGDKTEEVYKTLNKLSYGKITEEESLSQLANALGIEIPAAAQKAEAALNDLNNENIKVKNDNIDNKAINEDALKSDLNQIHELAFQTQKELSFSITADGIKYVVESVEDITKASDEAATAVRSLNDGLTVMAHTHPDGNGYLSIPDLYSGLNAKRMGVNSPVMAFGKSISTVLNLDGVTDDVIQQVRKKLSESKSQEFLSPKLFSEIQNIFKSGGFENALTKIDMSQGPDNLVNYFKQISISAKEAQSPLEQLQALISYYSQGKLNANNMSSFSNYWDEFKQGAKSAAETFDLVMAKIDARDKEGNLIQTSAKKYQSLTVAMKNIAVGDNAADIQKEANAHKENAAAIKEEAAAKDKLDSTKDKTSTQMDDSRAEVEKTISSYEELCSVIERYNKLASKLVIEGAGLTKQEDRELSDITSRIEQTKTGGVPDKMVGHAVAWNSLVDPITRTVNTDRIAKYLGIEIPQAAEKAKQAIKEVDNTKVMQKEAESQESKTKSKLEEAKKAKSDLSSEKSMIDESEISAANAKLEEFINLTKTIRNSPVLENIDIGNFKGQLAAASNTLNELHKKGLVTAEDMSKINQAGSEALDYLDNLEKDNDKDVIDLKSSAQDAKRLQGELESTQQQLAESKAKAEELSNELANVSNKLQELSSKNIIDEQSIKDAQLELKKFISLCNEIADIDALSDKEIGAYDERLKSSAQNINELKSKGMLTDKEYNKSKEPQLAAFERLQWITDNNKKVAKEQERVSKKQIADLKKQINAMNSSDNNDEMQANLAAADSQIKTLEAKLKKSDFTGTILDKQIAKLKGQLESKEAELNSLRAAQSSDIKTTPSKERVSPKITNTKTESTGKTTVKATDASTSVSSSEVEMISKLESKLKEVKAAIEAKTQAFREEGSTVDSVVASEAAALEKLSSKLDEIVTKIKLVGDSFKQINSGAIDQAEGAVEAKQEKTQTTTGGVDTTSGKWALDSTLSTTNSILQSILTAVNSGDSENQIADALKGAINELKAAAEAIKVNANDFKNKSKEEAKDTQKETQTPKKTKTFDELKSDEISGFEKYKQDVENSIYATDKFKSKLGELYSSLSNVKDADGLKAWKESFSGFQNEFDRFKNANQKVLTGQVNAIKNEAKAAMKGLDLDPLSDDPEKRAKQEEIAQGFKEIQIASEICASKIKSNQNAEIDALNATKRQLLENINAYRQQYGLLNGGKNGRNFGSTAVMQETTRYNKFQQYANDESAGYKDSATFNKALARYTSAYEKLVALRKKISSQSVRTDKDEQEFNDAKRAAAEYGKELDKLLARSKRLEQNSYTSSAIGGDINTEDAFARKQALTDFIVGMQGANESTMKFSKNYEECTFKMKNGDGTWTKMTATLDKTSNKMYATAGEVTKYGTAIGEFGAALKGEFLKLGRYMIASFGIEEVIQVVRQGITYVKEIDDALTDLKKVTNETDEGYARFLQTMSKTAGVVGSTVAELTTMASEWARLGYSMQEAADLAESTAILLNVSEFENATDASEALISTIQAFGYAADDSMHVVDILNEVKVTCLLIQ